MTRSRLLRAHALQTRHRPGRRMRPHPLPAWLAAWPLSAWPAPGRRIAAAPAKPLLASALAAALLLAGCADHALLPESSAPDARPVATAPRPAPEALRRELALRRARVAEAREAASRANSPDSVMIAAYFARIERELIARGSMRTDDGRAEGPLTVGQMVDDFVAVALHDEYVREGGNLVRAPHPAPLRRWQDPVRIRLVFGESVSPGQQVRDRNIAADYAQRLGQITGHDVAVTGAGGNFTLFIVNEDERRHLAPALAAAAPGMPGDDIVALVRLNPQTACTVLGYGRGGAPVYAEAVGVVRAELPPRSRTACFHEEMAQGLGLPNDSETVRPSIFNDDEEFAHLTHHDEILLRMLYDPRLRPGMSEAEARPILTDIATGLLHPTS